MCRYMAKNNNGWSNRQILKVILNFWTFLAMILFAIDFFSGNRFDSESSAIGIIYLSILGVYVTEKEYTRWKNHFVSRFFGEFFILLWTVLLAIFVVGAPLSEGGYRIPTEFVVTYTGVIAIFIISQRSKFLKIRG